MKSLAQSSLVSWLLLVVGATFLAPLSPGQSEKPPQRDRDASDPPCPTIMVSCPSDIKDGELQIATVTVAGGDSRIVPTYNWTVYGVTIIEGQGTPTIKFTLDPDAGSYTTAVEVDGLDPTCSRKASCSTTIHKPPPPPEKFDSYGILPIKKEALRLDNFATALRSHPGAMGYILFYGGRHGMRHDAHAVAKRAKAYLLTDDDIHPARLVLADGGFRETLTIDLWVVPPGAALPGPTPTVDASEVKIIDAPPGKATKRP